VSPKTRATIADLYKVDGKAELVNGEIVCMSPTGGRPGIAGGEIFASLREYARRTRTGRAFPDTGMRFPEGAPVFAVEVRSEHDYGRAAERERRAKRADYFACGTLVVWDVDLQSEDVVKSYKASDPDNPVIFRRGEIADAEPAVPGWTMAVDELFA
jgi:Uma2 family endonuclease